MRTTNNRDNKRILFPCGILLITVLIIFLFMYLSKHDTKLETFENLGFHNPLQNSQVITLSLESEYMGRAMPYILYLPKGYGDQTEYPVWYGLNSYGTDEEMWIKSGIAEAADELIDAGEIGPIIMVFPYTKDATLQEIENDLEDGIVDERNIDQFLTKELIPFIDSHYYSAANPENRYIGGFSLGGMIALRTAFHHTDLFGKVGGYSPGVLSSDYSEMQLEKWLYPNDRIDDVETFDKEKGFQNLQVHLDAGNSNDPFSEGIQSLFAALQKRGIPSEFELYDGGHTLRKSSIKDYLRFYARIE